MIGEMRNFMPVDVGANGPPMNMLETMLTNVAIGKEGDAFEVMPAILSMIIQKLEVVLWMGEEKILAFFL